MMNREAISVSNMLDYIRWRGDLPFAMVPLGEVDGLILAQLSMIRWEEGLEGSATLRFLVPLIREEPVAVGFTADNDKKLLTAVETSERFGSLRISDYVHQLDERSEMQFGAITLHLAEDAHYIAFRGTDNSVVGWKEDFNMAFSEPVPAQGAAVDYLERIAEKYKGRLWVGGHSKGGNLAMYAASGVSDSVRERIAQIYNFDRPGFSDRMEASVLYGRIEGKLHSYLPQGSVVGLLLAHPEAYTVVKSNSIGVLQHDPYSWQVEGPGFLRMPGLNADSTRLDTAFRQWLSEMSDEDRTDLVDTLFEIINATEAKTFGREFWIGLSQNMLTVGKTIRDLEPEKRNRVLKMIAELGALARRA